MMAYYRRTITSGWRDFVTVGVLPLAAVGFLTWITGRLWQQAPHGQQWTILAILASGIVVMLAVRFRWRPEFFRIRLEKYEGPLMPE